MGISLIISSHRQPVLQQPSVVTPLADSHIQNRFSGKVDAFISIKEESGPFGKPMLKIILSKLSLQGLTILSWYFALEFTRTFRK